MRYETFLHMAHKLAETAGRKRGVSIGFGGSMAYTDGRHINLPALPPGTIMTPEQQKIYMGYLEHETAHIRFTDFDHVPDRRKNLVLGHLQNVIEDIRIENLYIEEYPGTRSYLDALCHYVDKKDKENPDVPNVLSLIYYECYKKHRNVDTFLYTKELGDHPEYADIKAALDKDMPRLKTTEDATRLAKKILDLLPPEDKRKMQQSQENPHTVRQSILGQLIGEILYLNDKVEGPDRTGQLTDTGGKGPSPDAKGGRGSNHVGNSWFPPYTTKNDRVFVPADVNMSQYEATRNTASAEILAAKKMLRIFLQSRTKRAWNRGLEVGKLDTGRLHALIATQNTRVMKEKRDIIRENSAIEVLIDLSGSMNAENVRLSSILICEALDSIPKIKMEIVGFRTGRGGGWQVAHELGPKASQYGRLDSIDMEVFKTFDQPYKDAKPHLGAIKTGGGTPLGDAYGYALERILTRSEPRKALWIISDGDPATSFGNRNHSDYKLMERLLKKARRLGVEVVGMHLGARSNLTRYVDKMILVRDRSMLAQALMDMTRSQIG